MLQGTFNYVLRKFRRDPAFTLIAILLLALGIGANTAVFSIIDPLVLQPLPFKDSDRLVQVYANNTQYDWEELPLSWLDFVDLKEQSRSFEDIAAIRARGFNLTGLEKPIRVDGAEVSSSFFSLMGIPVAQGRSFTAAEERSEAPVAVINDAFMRRYFSSSNPLGSTIQLDGTSYTVVGVMPPVLQFPSRDTALWIPLKLRAEERDRAGYTLSALARLAPGVTEDQAEEDLDTIAASLAASYPATNRAKSFEFMTLYQLVYGRAFGSAATIFVLAVLFVHFIALANLANLLLAKAVAQEQEFAIRLSLGGRTAHLVRLFLAECLALCLLGGILGLFLGYWGTRLLVRWLPENIPRLENVAMDGRVILFTVLLSLVTAILLGLVPAVLLKKPNLAGLMNEQGRGSQGGVRKKRLRRLLVVVEMALTCVLLISSFLLIRSFQGLTRTDPGFEARDLLAFQISKPAASGSDSPEGSQRSLVALYDQMIESLDALPDVKGSTFASELPGDSASGVRFTVAGQEVATDERQPIAEILTAGPKYFSVLGILLLKGRALQPSDDIDAQRVAVINEALVRLYFGDKDPIGEQLMMKGEPWQVVGVVGDVRQSGLEDPPSPTIYISYRQQDKALEVLSVAVRSAPGDPLRLTSSAQAAVDRVLRGVPIYEVKTMERILADDIAGTGTMARLLGVFAFVAFLLAFTGIYGVMSYSVSRRFQEIGVRMALGATRANVVRMVVKEGVFLSAIGVLCGALLAAVVTRLLLDWVQSTGPLDVMVYLLVALLLASVGVLASLLPAHRATRIVPTLLLYADGGRSAKGR